MRKRLAWLLAPLALYPLSGFVIANEARAAEPLPQVMKIRIEGRARNMRPVDVELTTHVLRQNADGSFDGKTSMSRGAAGSQCGIDSAPTKLVLSGEKLTISYVRSGSPQFCGPVTYELNKSKTHLFEGVHPEADTVKIYVDAN